MMIREQEANLGPNDELMVNRVSLGRGEIECGYDLGCKYECTRRRAPDPLFFLLLRTGDEGSLEAALVVLKGLKYVI